MNPVLVIKRKTTSRNHAMGMGMMQDVLAPRMEDAHKADIGAQVLRIGSDLQQRCGAGAEQKVIQDFLVCQREWRKLMGKREDDMYVGHLCARAHKCLYVLFPVMLCSIAANAIRADIVGNNNT